jgi:Fructosamine-3-kinase
MRIPNSIVLALGKRLCQQGSIQEAKLELEPVYGGDINLSFIAHTSNTPLFIKLNRNKPSDFFAAEHDGLKAIQQLQAVRCPSPLLCTQIENWHCLVMEYIPLKEHGLHGKLGQKLAFFHQKSTHSLKSYGFDKDNYIGGTVQQNGCLPRWGDFWIERRIQPQLHRAINKGYKALLTLKTPTINAIKTTLSDHQPAPCLLHGDLWSGNKAFDQNGEPVIFDPACYIGDREADIAMTELFGGFNADFYSAYSRIWALDKGYINRKNIYNLYHLLNHVNLFGEGYVNSTMECMESIMACKPA